jgi:sterol desaturase/sphingolipid hydroxylase (fatty acid hydroxylase superfamily)
MSKIIVFAFPVFLAAMAFEIWWDKRQRASGAAARSTYAFSDTLNSLSLGLLSQVVGVLAKGIGIAVYAWVFERIALFPQAEVWKQWYGWLGALLLYDLCYYWLHRAGHEVAIFWAAHVVHHQSQEYNLSTALRQTSSGALLGWVFYLPLAMLGVPPLLFGIVALVDLLYQFWVHTEHVGKLGWFDRVFCSPSNHRVHHAVNEGYVDRNYGGILVVWDRLFGTFQEEHEPCVYGTRAPLNSWDPLWANLEVYARLCATAWHTPRWRDKLAVWFKPPGWQPAGALPKPSFDIAKVQRFAPPLSRDQQWFASLQYLGLMGAGTLYLWHADAMPWVDVALYCAALCAAAWATGCYLQGRLRALEVLAVQAACVAALVGLGLWS